MTDCYCAAVRLAARKLTTAYDEALAPAGINVAQFGLLRRIARLGPVSLTELGRQSSLDRSTVGRNVRVLQRQRLIADTPGEDEREACVVLAPAGERTLKTAEPLWRGVKADFESKLGKDAAQLRRLLARL